MNNQANQPILKPILISVMSGLIVAIIIASFSEIYSPLENLLTKQISLRLFLISCIGIFVSLSLFITFAFKFHKLQKELKGKTKKCLSIKHLTSTSKHFLKEHIKTLTMSYGSNKNVIEELLNLNIIEPYDKINYKLTYWFFECLNKNPNILDYKN